jgi:two-component system sensor kinase FixL
MLGPGSHFPQNARTEYVAVPLGAIGVGFRETGQRATAYELSGGRSRDVSDDRTWASSRTEVLRAAMLLSALALTYYLGVRVGMAFTPASHAVSLLWPPNAIVLVALLLCPRRAWIWPLLAVLPVHLISEVAAGVPLLMAACWYISNVSEALLGAGLILYFLGEAPRFDRMRHVIVYLVAAVFCAPVVSSFLDAAFVALVGWRYEGDYWAVVRSRLPSNMLAAIIVPPFAIIMFRDSVRLLRSVSPARWLEAAVLLAALAAVSFVVFHQPKSPAEAAVYVYGPLPLLVWAAVRTGVGGVAVSVAVLALIAITGTLSGNGPFLWPQTAIAMLSLQIFLIVAASTLMLLAAALADLHKARIAALRSRARLNLALNAARLGTWEWRMSTDRMTWHFAGRWGPILSGSVASHAELLNRAHPSDRARILAATHAAREQGNDVDLEWRFECNGRVRWIRALGKVHRDHAGRPANMIGVCVDVTRRKHQEQQQRAQREKLAHLTLAATVGELAGTLAHEMSQPLAAIMLNATVAQHEAQKVNPDLPELRAIIADILADDQRASDVIHRLHALLPRGPIEREPVQVADSIHSILALEHGDLIARNVTVELDIEPNLPLVTAAPAQLQQVLLNLIVNACDAMAALSGQRHLRIAARHVSGEIHVAVSDNGPGVEDFERVFQLFFSTRERGVGLGLSVARSIVVAHGGRLWGANSAGGGAVFCIALPVTSEPTEASAAAVTSRA